MLHEGIDTDSELSFSWDLQVHAILGRWKVVQRMKTIGFQGTL